MRTIQVAGVEVSTAHFIDGKRVAHNIEFFADFALKLNHETIDSPEVVNHVRFDPAGVAALKGSFV